MEIITQTMRESAEKFILNWRGISSERAESQTFINEFFEIFGLYRKDYAQFEKPIRKKNEQGTGFADLFWSGKLIIEAKSAGKDSEKHWENTLKQAEEYIENLFPYQRPQYILLMNFKRFMKYSVEQLSSSKKIKIHFNTEIPIEDLANQLDEFLFFPEFAHQLEDAEEKINQEAARLIANVYDSVERKGYNHGDIAIILARLMFCMFAEDTGIFRFKQFENYLREQTTTDNLGDKLKQFFEILNRPYNQRGGFDPVLMEFPYVNGGLFRKEIDKLPTENTALRDTLIKCCEYDWSFISPVIFGSLFQAVMHQEDRRTLGAHYTSEKNIMRVVRPLFLDELRQEFESVKHKPALLEKFRKKLSNLRFLDPACGCGNFLVVTYRELRLLDIEIIRLQNKGNFVIDVNLLNNVLLSNFYGYEIDSTSAMIAEVAMWLTEHQMNMRLENEFGKTIPTIPLKEAAQIKNCNSLTIEWTTGIEGKYFDYILGNPPFVGKQFQSIEQKKDIERIFKRISGTGILDYVTCWYVKAAEYMYTCNSTQSAFVSTNSITQGEQVGFLWSILLGNYKIKIQFAHRTFCWSNEAKGNAAVHVVIIGFSCFDSGNKRIFEYEHINGEPYEIKVKNINPYLVEGKDFVLNSRTKPLCNVQPMMNGSMPNDDGNFLFTTEEKDEFLKLEPNANKWIKRFVGAYEYINNVERWCLWLKDIDPKTLRELSYIMERINNVKEFRNLSTREATRKLANYPSLFGEIRQPNNDYLIAPVVSSINRNYIPIAIYSKDIIASNLVNIIPNASKFTFGIISSKMMMIWIKNIAGRLKSDWRLTKDNVYNNFPWPENTKEKDIKAVETAAQTVLDIRLIYTEKGNSLADLYDPNTMPPDLLKAHQTLDKAVDKCYRDAPFTSEAKRIEFLFELYEKYTANLFTVVGKKRGRK
jgi:type II restriction/modification system DNA methylase subunit YeeA